MAWGWAGGLGIGDNYGQLLLDPALQRLPRKAVSANRSHNELCVVGRALGLLVFLGEPSMGHQRSWWGQTWGRGPEEAGAHPAPQGPLGDQHPGGGEVEGEGVNGAGLWGGLTWLWAEGALPFVGGQEGSLRRTLDLNSLQSPGVWDCQAGKLVDGGGRTCPSCWAGWAAGLAGQPCPGLASFQWAPRLRSTESRAGQEMFVRR